MDELKKKIESLLHEVNSAMEKLKIADKERDLNKLREEIDYTDHKKVIELNKKEAEFERNLKGWKEDANTLQDLVKLADLGDKGLLSDIKEEYEKVESRFEEKRKELRFQGPYDDHDVILSIHAGAGGTDAQDWAEMLLRMYVRWAEAHGLKVKTIDQSNGEEAGIKSADIEIIGGSYLYGKLAGEHGVHRLVRLSPFNADHLRQTSFAKVEVVPLIDRPDDVQIDEKDLKVDVFRAGGHGGQSVNTTDSAVRVTHIPTGVTIAIQNERSQLQNKETALNILRSKLVQLSLEQHAENLAELKGPSQSAEWGNQIRSYVLHPYKQVKDNRTGYESSEVEKVLDGDLDPLIDAWLER